MKKNLLLILNIFLSIFLSSVSMAKEIRIGQVVNLSGEFKKYAHAITSGITAAIHKANKLGGVKGKQLVLVTHNDNGDPTQARAIVEDLKKQGIELFLGSMGTRSIQELIPELQAGSITILFPWSGDNAQRSSAPRHVINGPGLLKTQTEAIARYVCDTMHLKKIAFFHADDTFSTTGTQELQDAFKKRKMSPIAVTSYNRHTLNLKKASKKLIEADPKVVVCIGTSMPAVKLIKNFFARGLYNTTFIGIDSTFMVNDILADMGASFYYTAAVPNPKTSTLPIAREYLEALTESDPKALPSVLSFIYYICTQLTIDALQKTTTSKELLVQLESLRNHSIGGFTVSFDFVNRQLFGSTTYLIKD
jgi:ABC-type branched-subunit amino acid transport system substrate-binding protein